MLLALVLPDVLLLLVFVVGQMLLGPGKYVLRQLANVQALPFRWEEEKHQGVAGDFTAEVTGETVDDTFLNIL